MCTEVLVISNTCLRKLSTDVLLICDVVLPERVWVGAPCELPGSPETPKTQGSSGQGP
jgi:hypothetical protein